MYIYPKFDTLDLFYFRFFGSGLGNLLFTWSRACVIAKKYNLQLIEPTWPCINFGPFIRNETDFRFYGDLFTPDKSAIQNPLKSIILLTSKKVGENYLDRQKTLKNKRVLLVKGSSHSFIPFIKESKFIKKKLISITKNKHKSSFCFDFKNSISLHVRMGDFKNGFGITSFKWLINVIQTIRQKHSTPLKVWVFSDGRKEELEPLLRIPGVEKISFGSSIADLLALSQAKVLVGSKNSTFSMWASFLGRMPIILSNN